MKKTLIIVCSILLLLGGNAGTAVAFDLQDLLLNLYSNDAWEDPGEGIQGITMGGGPIDNGYAYPLDVVGITLNDSISGEIANLSLNSSVASFSVEIDTVTGLPIVTTEALGPIYSERARTLGKGIFKFGASASYFNFTEFEGDDIDSLTTVSTHRNYTPLDDGVLGDPAYELEQLQMTLDIEIEEYVVALFASYGLMDNLDISVIVPFVNLDMKIDAHAEILDEDGNILPDGSANHHFYTPGAPWFDTEPHGDTQDDSVSGDAYGIGDTIFRVKYFWKETEWADIAVATDLKVPTGDEKNLLGSDNFTLTPFIILSRSMYEGRFNPHFNFGYELFFDDDEFSQLKYAIGFDSLITKQISFAADIIGNNELSGDGIGDDLYDLSVGAKFNPWRDLVLFANVQVPLNDDGLRADFVPSVGAEISF